MTRLVGVILLVLGVVLLIFGFNAKESFASEVSETVTGNPTDATMWYLIFGAVAAVAGLVLAVRAPRRV